MKVVVGFSRPRQWNPFSALITWVEGVPFSHCYIRFYSQDFGQEMVAHAKVWNVHLLPWEKFLSTSVPVVEYVIDVSDVGARAGMYDAGQMMGRGYGYAQLFGFLMMRIFKGKNPIKDHGVICSEHVARFLHIALHLPGEVDYNSIGLKKIYDETRGLVMRTGATDATPVA